MKVYDAQRYYSILQSITSAKVGTLVNNIGSHLPFILVTMFIRPINYLSTVAYNLSSRYGDIWLKIAMFYAPPLFSVLTRKNVHF